MKKLLFSSALVLSNLLLFSQKTIVLQPGPEVGKDAVIYWIENIEGRNGDMMNINYGNLGVITGEAWTVDGDFFIARSLLEFDLTSLPENAEILSAKLSLYFEGNYPHQSLSGSNELLIQRVTAPWNEGSVTWNNQPTVSHENQLTVPETVFENQHLIDFDVTPLVMDMHIINPNHGFLIRLKTEDYYRRARYASSDFAFSSSRPKLEITYQEPEPCVEIVYDTIKIEVTDTMLIYQTIYDTIQVTVEVHDTVFQYISVSDTLVIDAWFTGIERKEALSVIKIYPNPTRQELHISIPEYEKMSDHSLKIIDQQGKSIFATYINQASYTLHFDAFANRGLYFVTILDPQYKLLDSRKILLE